MLDERLLRVTIFLSGVPHVYERLSISAIGTKFTTGISNVAEIRISNIDKAVRDKLLTEGTPLARQSPPKNEILIEAGRVSTDYFEIFSGDITDVRVSQPPDITIIMHAVTGQLRRDTSTTLSMPAVSLFSQVALAVSKKMELPIDFKAPEKNVANFSWSGSIEKMVFTLGEIFRDVVAYVDDERLVVRPLDESDKATIDISMDTGLIGIPEWINLGVRCKVLVNQAIELGSRIKLTSEAYPDTNGTYIVYRLAFNLANRDNPFYYLFDATVANEDIS